MRANQLKEYLSQTNHTRKVYSLRILATLLPRWGYKQMHTVTKNVFKKNDSQIPMNRCIPYI